MTTAADARHVRITLPADGSDPGETYQKQLSLAIDEFQAAVMRNKALDPVTAELVRIRCAHVHTCRTCSQVRMGAGQEAGVDEDLLAQVDFYETSSLPERQKVALRLADAHIFGSVAEQLAAQVGEHLTPDEAVAIALLVSKFSLNKSMVALGIDGPSDDRVLIDYDDDGLIIWH